MYEEHGAHNLLQIKHVCCTITIHKTTKCDAHQISTTRLNQNTKLNKHTVLHINNRPLVGTELYFFLMTGLIMMMIHVLMMMMMIIMIVWQLAVCYISLVTCWFVVVWCLVVCISLMA